VCIYRIPRGESLLWPGSHCPSCNRPIKPLELVPVLSWAVLGGKCRGCGMRISPRYPLVELLTGAAFYCSAVYSGGSMLRFAVHSIFLCGLIVVFFIDLDHYIIPNKVLLPMAVAGLAAAAMQGTLKDSLTAALAGFAGFYVIAVLGTLLMKKDAMGGGDVKFAGVIGLYLGLDLMLAGMFMAFFIGVAVTLPMLAMKKRTTADPVPFGPMMAAGAAISLFHGHAIIDWYGSWVAGMVLM